MTKTAAAAATATAATQLRGICAACFNQQALRNGLLVQHGYTRPQQWSQNVGTCAGTGRAHFGTDAGRVFTREIAAGLRRTAESTVAHARRVTAGEADVYRTRRVHGGNTTERVENPTDYQREQYATQLEREANGCISYAAEFDARADAWVPVEPVVVTVAAKPAPALHWRTARRWQHGKACASSAMGAYRGGGNHTSDLAHVTCPKCLALAARFAEKDGAK